MSPKTPEPTTRRAKTGNLSLRLGLGWSKSNSFHTGQTPVLRYNRQLMLALLNDRLPIAKIVNAQAIRLEDAPKGYAEFDKGIAANSCSTRTACWPKPPRPPQSGVRSS